MVDAVLVDTDVLIDAARGIGDAVKCHADIEERSLLAISAVTQMELIVGCQTKTELKALDRFLARFRLATLDQNISDAALDLLRRYRLSHGLLIADALVAATALSLNQPFVSKNQRDYRFIAGLRLLPYPEPFSAAIE